MKWFPGGFSLEQGAARMLPVCLRHAPSPQKPSRNAGAREKKNYREALKQQNLNTAAIEELEKLRAKLPGSIQLVAAGDGSFTNGKFIGNMPENTVNIGRARKEPGLPALPIFIHISRTLHTIHPVAGNDAAHRFMKNILRRFTGGLLLALTLPFLVAPFAGTCRHLLTDRGLRSAAPSEFAFRLHRSLSRRLPGYVERRIDSGVAETLSVSQITATEWPVYGAFFYLLATENLQRQWEADPSLARQAPAESGAEAIDACLKIVLDPGHAHWVKKYWGDDYLQDPNCFFRTLLIGSISAHFQLTGDDSHLPMLRQLVGDLVADIDASPHGLIDDYPSQCFPCDVAVAIAMVLRTDSSLGTDHRAWAAAAMKRMLGNFGGALPPYMADARSGQAAAGSRGCTNGYFFSFAREINPAASNRLYEKFVEDFWQDTGFAAGWREFPRGSKHPELHFDPDSGPVISGFGTGASGLGLGAARLRGDHERAGRLGAEMLASAWPMPGGSLLLPRLVSDQKHAPYFAECAILHQLSLASPRNAGPRAGLPGCVWFILALQFFLSLLLLRISWRLLRKTS